MALIFSNRLGSVTRVPTRSMSPSALYLDTGELGLTGNNTLITNAIVTGCSVTEAVSLQTTKSLLKSIHMAVFGDELSQISLQGLAFSQICQGGRVANNLNVSGLQRIQQIYHNNKVSVRYPPLYIDVSGVPYTAFLVAGNWNWSDTRSQIAQWQFTFIGFPSPAIRRALNA